MENQDFNGKGKDAPFWQIGVTVDLPIWTGLTRIARIQEADARQKAAIEQSNVLKASANAEIVSAIGDWNSSKAQFLAAAKSDMVRKDDEYNREKNLFDAGGSSQSSLDAYHTASVAANNEVVALENQIHALSVNEEFGHIIAPVSGIISAKLREPGDVVMPGQPVYQITTTGGARVHVEFPQELLKQVKQETVLQLFHAGDTLDIKLDRIYPLVNGFDLGAAESDLKQLPFDLANGARLTGRIVLQQSQTGIEVPSESIITSDNNKKSYVFKVNHSNHGDVLQKVPVTILLTGRNGVSVSGNIQPGDKVIVGQESVLLSLRDGDPVIINKGGSL